MNNIEREKLLKEFGKISFGKIISRFFFVVLNFLWPSFTLLDRGSFLSRIKGIKNKFLSICLVRIVLFNSEISLSGLQTAETHLAACNSCGHQRAGQLTMPAATSLLWYQSNTSCYQLAGQPSCHCVSQTDRHGYWLLCYQ